jgi:hypothetical protein
VFDVLAVAVEVVLGATLLTVSPLANANVVQVYGEPDVPLPDHAVQVPLLPSDCRAIVAQLNVVPFSVGPLQLATSDPLG